MRAKTARATVVGRPDWAPESYKVIRVSREEILAALDRHAQQFFGLSAEEFLHKYRSAGNGLASSPAFADLASLADLLAPAEA